MTKSLLESIQGVVSEASTGSRVEIQREPSTSLQAAVDVQVAPKLAAKDINKPDDEEFEQINKSKTVAPTPKLSDDGLVPEKTVKTVKEEQEQLAEMVYSNEDSAKKAAKSLSKKENDGNYTTKKHKSGGYAVDHAYYNSSQISKKLKGMQEEQLDKLSGRVGKLTEDGSFDWYGSHGLDEAACSGDKPARKSKLKSYVEINPPIERPAAAGTSKPAADTLSPGSMSESTKIHHNPKDEMYPHHYVVQTGKKKHTISRDDESGTYNVSSKSSDSEHSSLEDAVSELKSKGHDVSKAQFKSLNESLPREDGAVGVYKIKRGAHLKIGQDADFYEKGTGDKKYGLVHKYDGKSVTFKTKSGMHKYKIVQEDSEQLDELSKSTLGSYVKKASANATMHASELGRADAHDDEVSRLTNRHMSYKDKDEVGKSLRKALGADHATRDKLRHKAVKRLHGIRKAVDKITEAEQLDELSKSTLGSYVKKAVPQLQNLAVKKSQQQDTFSKHQTVLNRGTKEAPAARELARLMSIQTNRNMKKTEAKQINRQKGVSTAVTKLTRESTDSPSKYLVGVHLMDPSKKSDEHGMQKKIRVTAESKEHALKKAKSHYTKAGYKVKDCWHAE